MLHPYGLDQGWEQGLYVGAEFGPALARARVLPQLQYNRQNDGITYI